MTTIHCSMLHYIKEMFNKYSLVFLNLSNIVDKLDLLRLIHDINLTIRVEQELNKLEEMRFLILFHTICAI